MVASSSALSAGTEVTEIISPTSVMYAVGETKNLGVTCKDSYGNTITCPPLYFQRIPLKYLSTIDIAGYAKGVSVGNLTVKPVDFRTGKTGGTIYVTVKASSPIPTPSSTLTPTPSPCIDDASLNKGMYLSYSAANKYQDKGGFVKDSASNNLWWISTNAWAVSNSISGYDSVTYDGYGKFIIKNNLSGISGSFGGMPSIEYGRSAWGDFSDTEGQCAKFPIRLNTAEGLTIQTVYDLTYSKFTGNIAYDLWLTPTATHSNGAEGALEVMIWFYKRNQWAIGNFYETTTIGGRTYDVYVRHDTGQDLHTISFIPQGDTRAVDGQGTKSGDITIDILQFTNYAVEYANNNMSMSSDLYLQGINFGTEFDKGDTEGYSQDYTFTLTKFAIIQTRG